jgi:hypothetical protein
VELSPPTFTSTGVRTRADAAAARALLRGSADMECAVGPVVPRAWHYRVSARPSAKTIVVRTDFQISDAMPR